MQKALHGLFFLIYNIMASLRSQTELFEFRQVVKLIRVTQMRIKTMAVMSFTKAVFCIIAGLYATCDSRLHSNVPISKRKH